MKIVVITGPKGAGKTSLLLQYASNYAMPVLFGHLLTTNPDPSMRLVSNALEIISILTPEIDAVLIDDFHRFKLSDARTLYTNVVLSAEKDLIIAGRNLDQYGHAYISMLFFMPIADQIEYLTTACSVEGCSETAIYTIQEIENRIIYDEHNRIASMSEILEHPVCRKHFNEFIASKRRLLHDPLYMTGIEYDNYLFWEIFRDG